MTTKFRLDEATAIREIVNGKTLSEVAKTFGVTSSVLGRRLAYNTIFASFSNQSQREGFLALSRERIIGDVRLIRAFGPAFLINRKMKPTVPNVWHLTFYGADDRTVADITLTDDQARAIWQSRGVADTEPDPYGEFIVEGYLGACEK